MHTPASPTLVSFRRHGRFGPITCQDTDPIPTGDREQNFGEPPGRDIHSTSPSPSAPVSSRANSPLRAWHVAPGQIFGSFAIGKPRAGFFALHAIVPTVCQPYTHYFYHTTLYSEGGVIEGREGETNHPVRLVDTGLSTHTYLSPHLFVVLRFPSAQSSYPSILRFWHLPPQSRDCDHIYSSLLLPLTSQDQEVHLRSIGPFSFPYHFRPVHLCR